MMNAEDTSENSGAGDMTTTEAAATTPGEQLEEHARLKKDLEKVRFYRVVLLLLFQ